MGRFCRLALGRLSSRTGFPLHHQDARSDSDALNMAAKPPHSAAKQNKDELAAAGLLAWQPFCRASW
jgi:hypothetical protein